MGRKGRGQDKRGRSKRSGQYVGVPYVMIESAAWRSLSGAALKVYFELHRRYWGGNNGELSLSLEEGKRLLGLGKSTVKRALAELEAKGFIALVKRGHFYGRLASEYRLTSEMCGSKPATNDWKRWEPEKPANSERGPEATHIGRATVPSQDRDGRICAV